MMKDDGAAVLALRYLRELSPAVRDAAVVAPDGAVIAGTAPSDHLEPGLTAVRAEADATAVVATVPTGVPAALAGVDAATAGLIVRGRC